MALQSDAPPQAWSPPAENLDFPYPALNRERVEIRLLRLHPRVSDHPVQCQLFTSSLSTTPPKFSALSYTWGAPPAAQQIFINGCQFWVRDSLFDFLRIYAKYSRKPTLLWVDAICIDQSSTRERNHQVGLMRQIYSSAAIVYVWLGALYARDRDIVWLLKEMEQVVTRPGPRVFSDLKDIDSYSKRIISAHSQLTHRPYFHRVWIVQEIVLARRVEVWIGKHSILWQSWRDFIQFYLQAFKDLTDVNYAEDYPESVWDQLDQLRYELGTPPIKTMHLGRLVSTFARQKCSDPHDRIYALLGLVSPPLPDFPIKYHDSLVHVFKHAYGAIPDRDVRTITDLVGSLRLEREILHRCIPCQDVSLQVLFARVATIQRDSLTLDPHKPREFEFFDIPNKPMMVAHSNRSDRDRFASLTPSTMLRASDAVFSLAYFQIGKGFLAINLAIAEDKALKKVPKPCISVRGMKTFLGDLPQTAYVRLHYCLISALIEESTCQWSLGKSAGSPVHPQLILEAPMETMIRWMLAVKWIESLSAIKSHTAVILDLEERGLVTPQQSKLCQEYSEQFDASETMRKRSNNEV